MTTLQTTKLDDLAAEALPLFARLKEIEETFQLRVEELAETGQRVLITGRSPQSFQGYGWSNGMGDWIQCSRSVKPTKIGKIKWACHHKSHGKWVVAIVNDHESGNDDYHLFFIGWDEIVSIEELEEAS